METALSIPPELHDQTIDHLCDDKSALRSCALVCRSWLPRSRLHLFQSVRLTGVWKEAEEFSAHLTTHPTLGRYVRRLEVRGHVHARTMISILRMVEALEVLDAPYLLADSKGMDSSSHPWIDELLVSILALRCLRALRLNAILAVKGVQHRIHGFMPVHLNFSHLQLLDLSVAVIALKRSFVVGKTGAAEVLRRGVIQSQRSTLSPVPALRKFGFMVRSRDDPDLNDDLQSINDLIEPLGSGLEELSLTLYLTSGK